MLNMKSLPRFLMLLTLGLFTVFSGYSQVTTSSMTGIVSTETGERLPGATVVATHEPSGTVYGTVTKFDGSYALQGMRPGGPYKVEISFVGYAKRTYTDIRIFLGETFGLNTSLQESQVGLGEVTVVGVKSSQFKSTKTGASTNISNEQLTLMPSISRSISSIAQLSPYTNGMSIAGGDGRSTNFTVDGSNFNNNFGLSSNLPGGGTPISLDAIEEIQVVVAPFDVRQTNFIVVESTLLPSQEPTPSKVPLTPTLPTRIYVATTLILLILAIVIKNRQTFTGSPWVDQSSKTNCSSLSMVNMK
jgi:hypothetical protein